MASSPFYLAIYVLLFPFALTGYLPRSCLAQSLCHYSESVALLEFKQSFRIRCSSSLDSWGNSKLNNDCCLWDGVECDQVSGHVIGLDLGSSCLYGSINSNSSLFNLIHLQRLHLGDNNFKFSQIPPEIGRLTKLIYLNLSTSVFSGEIPLEIAQLDNLSVLDLGGNTYDDSDDTDLSYGLLKLDTLVLRKLIQRSRSLKILNLHYVQLSSTLPDSIGNLSLLSYLNLPYCLLSGPIPSSLGNLKNLGYLNLAYNNFSGHIPSSFTNLTQLTKLFISYNSFVWGKLPWLGKLNKLKILSLCGVNIGGQIPIALRNLTHLRCLSLHGTNLTGEIPSWLFNVSQLFFVRLSDNHLHGQIPKSITKLSKLETLLLSWNNLGGTIDFEIFSGLKDLVALELDENSLSVINGLSKNTSFPKFEQLGLGYCNLRTFPEFLRHQDQLISLKMHGNKIHGQIPNWVVNMSAKTLSFMDLSNNLLMAFEQPYLLSNLTSLIALFLNDNMLHGSLPIATNSIHAYSASNNFLSGEIPESFCGMHSLLYFDLSNNNFTGKIPLCLGNFSVSLLMMRLASNSLHGTIPSTFMNESRLMLIDLGHNQLEGRLPRSLANCKRLQKFDIGENNIADEFPSWLGSLPNLEVLILRSNQFFGSLRSTPATMSYFPKLRILDLSSNHFMGVLPSEFFQNFSHMMMSDMNQFTYMMVNVTHDVGDGLVTTGLVYNMALRNKGVDVKYEHIPNVLVAIILSNNKFHGEIPLSLTKLGMLEVLDLSNNSFSGHIPTGLANMTRLESLDLSLNTLSGEIPPQLTKLTFLEYFNVSGNQLVGAIPVGKQFNTFDNTSYAGNSGLCGGPLSRKCQSSKSFDPPNSDDSGSPLEFSWKVVVIGYGSGLIVGVVVGYLFGTWKHAWLLKTFRINQPVKTRRRNRSVAVTRRS